MTNRQPASQPNSDLLTAREVARALKVDPTTVRRWIECGSLQIPRDVIILPHGGRRNCYRVRRSSLDRILDGADHADQHKA